MHEYGHHVLQHFGEQPAPDYNNGVCDDPGFFTIDAGHCFWQPEKGSTHWIEGWASYFSEGVTTSLGKNDTIGRRVDRSSRPRTRTPTPNFDQIEGYTTAILGRAVRATAWRRASARSGTSSSTTTRTRSTPATTESPTSTSSGGASTTALPP